jgi:ribonuclease HI
MTSAKRNNVARIAMARLSKTQLGMKNQKAQHTMPLIAPRLNAHRPNRAFVHFDASWCHTTRVSAWATWIDFEGPQERELHSGIAVERCKSSNHAEVVAACCGVWYAASAGYKEIILFGDNIWALNAMLGAYTAPQVTELLTEFPDLDICIKYVKAHQLLVDRTLEQHINAWCDTNAKTRMRAERKRIDPSYLSKKNKAKRAKGKWNANT